MTEWSLSQLLEGLHTDIQQRLEKCRKCFEHPGTKGNASETVWLELLQTYLPKRYQAETAHIVDCEGNFSDQIDVVIFDRQYSPFIFRFAGQTIIPAESVYAVFEAKQAISKNEVKYAQDKISSVRRLTRTSLPIPSAGGTLPARPLIHIFGGLLTFESDWNPPLGKALIESLNTKLDSERLDFGCVAAHGCFNLEYESERYQVSVGGKPATAFLFHLISQLQKSATVPMIDIQAYARWLSD